MGAHLGGTTLAFLVLKGTWGHLHSCFLLEDAVWPGGVKGPSLLPRSDLRQDRGDAVGPALPAVTSSRSL